jgi:hypothetical protein
LSVALEGADAVKQELWTAKNEVERMATELARIAAGLAGGGEAGNALYAVQRELWAAHAEIARMAAELEGSAQRTIEAGDANALGVAKRELLAANGERTRMGKELEEAREAAERLGRSLALPLLLSSFLFPPFISLTLSLSRCLSISLSLSLYLSLSLCLSFSHTLCSRTLDPRTSTLDHQLSTLMTQPSTLHPQPSTLNPQPSTLNSQPSTLNPHHNPQLSTTQANRREVKDLHTRREELEDAAERSRAEAAVHPPHPLTTFMVDQNNLTVTSMVDQTKNTRA